jgi:hypothetical protein
LPRWTFNSVEKPHIVDNPFPKETRNMSVRKEENFKAIQLMVPPAMMEQLDAIAKQEGGTSRATLVRRATAEFLRRYQNATPNVEKEAA